ncbi:hypothetical protein [Aeoliella mucimassa]|uniref:Lipoprotein n=1 Tax=Aeoliella mucimassa TaxID=2527972 RepID=A0A518AI52_9BACT|nr:hypothetical protein [Aeoliella mucimassa]QDU54409.1 hypothetical protein Pan181_05900 [Aeoliella mucimassa]
MRKLLILGLMLAFATSQAGCSWNRLNVWDGALTKAISGRGEKPREQKRRSPTYQGGFEF